MIGFFNYLWILWYLIVLFVLYSNCDQIYNTNDIKLIQMLEGFRITLPDKDGIKFIAFNVNINKEFKNFEAGQYIGHIIQKTDNEWSFYIKKNLNNNDIIYVWIAVQQYNSVYHIHLKALNRNNNNKQILTTSTTTTVLPILSKSIDDCETSITIELLKKRTICKGQLIFEDNFNSIQETYWNQEIHIPLPQDDAEFVLYNGTTSIENGILCITAQLYNGNVRRDIIDLGQRCTGDDIKRQCIIEPRLYYIASPIISGRINTRYKFVFKYGYIEVKAKLPLGDWLYPLILLEPNNNEFGKEHYNSGQLRLAFVRGNRYLESNMSDIGAHRLYGGAILTNLADYRHQSMAYVDIDTVSINQKYFSDDFHIYGLKWMPEEIVLTVDGYEYGRIPCDFKSVYNKLVWRKSSANAPFNEFFYITFGLAVGGHGDFPNNVEKPWENTSPKAALDFWNERGDWYPSWSQPSLEIDYVRVYAI